MARQPKKEVLIIGKLYREADLWRWEIKTADGQKYVDGGNFRDLEEAFESLQESMRLMID